MSLETSNYLWVVWTEPQCLNGAHNKAGTHLKQHGRCHSTFLKWMNCKESTFRSKRSHSLPRAWCAQCHSSWLYASILPFFNGCILLFAPWGLCAVSSLVKVKWKVTQSHPTPCHLMDCNLPVFYVHGIFRVRILEWIAVPFSRESSWLRDQTSLLHCRQINHHLKHQGSPRRDRTHILETETASYTLKPQEISFIPVF